MKYLKLLLIAVFASAILVSCYKDDVFEGKGDAVVQFDPDNDGENDVYFRTVNELPFNPSAAEITGALVSLPITYVGEPSTFPFSVEYDVEVVSGEGASYEDVAWQTSPNNIIYFGEGITEDEEGAPIPMTATSYIEFLPNLSRM